MQVAVQSKTQKRKLPVLSELSRNKWLYIMLIPGTIYYLVFKFIPFSYLIIVFQDYLPSLGIFKSPWVGFDNFSKIITQQTVYSFGLLMRNTILLAVYNLIFFFPMPLILSLLLNEIRHSGYKRSLQSFVYLPHFMSWSVIVGIVYLFLGPTGVVNKGLISSGVGAVQFLLNPSWFRPLIILEIIWKEIGWGTIIYLAALAGVDEQIYEASIIDGAGRLAQLWHITLPTIRSTIIILLILRMGTFMDSGFEQIFLMRNSINRQVSEVFDTYVYVEGVINGQFSYSTAIGLFKSLISLVLVIGTNKLAKLFDEEGVY